MSILYTPCKVKNGQTLPVENRILNGKHIFIIVVIYRKLSNNLHEIFL